MSNSLWLQEIISIKIPVTEGYRSIDHFCHIFTRTSSCTLSVIHYFESHDRSLLSIALGTPKLFHQPFAYASARNPPKSKPNPHFDFARRISAVYSLQIEYPPLRIPSLQIPEDLLQGVGHPRPTPLTAMGFPAAAWYPLSSAFSTASAASAQERAGASSREHQARPDLCPRQGEYCQNILINYLAMHMSEHGYRVSRLPVSRIKSEHPFARMLTRLEEANEDMKNGKMQNGTCDCILIIITLIRYILLLKALALRNLLKTKTKEELAAIRSSYEGDVSSRKTRLLSICSNNSRLTNGTRKHRDYTASHRNTWKRVSWILSAEA